MSEEHVCNNHVNSSGMYMFKAIYLYIYTYNIITIEILHICGDETEKGIKKMLTRGPSKQGA